MIRTLLPFATAAMLAGAMLAAGCAVTTLPGGGPGETSSKLKKPLPQSNETGDVGADGRYVLGAEELALNCKRLTGRMQVRILQLRDDGARAGSAVARSLHGTAVATVGGTQHGLDPAGQRRRDLALLDAYNRRLAEKGCPTFDLAKELQPHPAGHTPRPVMPVKKRP